jgi:hypothetical protein
MSTKTETAAKPSRPGAFKKGEKKPNQGKRGPNKTTVALKEMILGALDDAGGQKYLAGCASDPRTATAFLGLVGKVLPLQVTGANGGPMVFERIVREIVEPAK